MFKNITNISGISSKLGTIVRSARSKAVLTAAVAATGLGLSSSSFAAIYPTITSITTSFTAGSPTSVNNVTAYGTSNVSPFFPDTKTYTVNYQNNVDAIVSATAGGTTYNVTGLGTVVTRNYTPPTNENIWEDGGNTSNTVNLQGTQVTSAAAALGGNNILMGADNVFSNMGNSVGNNTSIDRVDVLFTGGLKAAASTAFAVYDRGPTTDHDSFKIAAILSVNGSGVPTSYGPLISFSDGNWGTTNVASTQQEIILRKNDSISNDPFHPSDSTGQPIGGVLIPSSGLVAANTTIYGYSLFSGAVPSSDTSAQLVDYADLPHSDSTSTGGGLDPIGVVGLEYQSSVPEPTSAALLTLGIGGYMVRRPKRKQA